MDYSSENRKLAKEIGVLLKQQKFTLATAESCTGGLISSYITDISGSSEYCVGGVVSYSNDLKVKLLGVRKNTLKKFGAVSLETAEEMAKGICKLTSANVAISTTGIAGPTGGVTGKPVGMVFSSILINNKIISFRFMSNGDRILIKDKTCIKVLQTLRKLLKNTLKKSKKSLT